MLLSLPDVVLTIRRKAARYFDVEEKYVFCTDERYVIDPEEAVKLIDENTIGICTIL